jgi:hypothetical protein
MYYLNMLTWWNDLHITSKNTRVLNVGKMVFTTCLGWPLSEKGYKTTNNGCCESEFIYILLKAQNACAVINTKIQQWNYDAVSF